MANKRRLMKAAALFALPAATLSALPGIAAAQVSVPSVPQDPQSAPTSGAELKLLTPRAGETVDNGKFALDVSFQSRNDSPITRAELWVDGVLWASRALDIPQLKNILSFEVDASTLAPGNHQFVVKTFSQDGAVAQTQVQVQVAGQEPDSFGGPEIAFQGIANSKKVSGVVEILLDAKPKGGINPYISIYVDKQFKTLKNYPPYSYTWDTTTVPNGYHTIEAMGYLENTNGSTTRRIRVYVDNPGGATVAMKTVPNLDKKAQPTPTTAVTANARPLTIPTATRAAKPAAPAAVKATDLKAADIKATAKAARPAKPTVASNAVLPNAPANTSIAKPAPAVASEVIAPRVETVAATTSRAAMPADAPVALEAFALPAGETVPVLPGSSARSVRAAATAARPKISAIPQPKAAFTTDPALEGVEKVNNGVAPVLSVVPTRAAAPLTAPVKTSAAAPKAAQPVSSGKTSRASKANPRAVVRPAGPSVMDLMNQPLQVAFDGQQIAFDVQPRVEQGLPLAPFRHIFEYTGGQVMWIPETRVVRAVNADREVVIAIGKSQARVNGKKVTLDKAAYVEQGRTMVPLSFVGQALDVDVQYDPATGRVSITSKN